LKPKRKPINTARERAINLLARREHSRKELNDKLLQKGFEQPEITEALDSLQAKNWLSDQRFTESWIRHRVNTKHGKLKICYELTLKGVNKTIINQTLNDLSLDWFEVAVKAWHKKYRKLPIDHTERAKQIRYLNSRGFSFDEANYALEQAKALLE
jgi:regulatory protein